MNHDYPVVRNNPVAKFYYKGRSHTHPVRRTVVMIENQDSYFRGFELREGAKVRNLGKAPIKTYRKNKIAKVGQIDARRALRANASANEYDQSTLIRYSLADLVKQGV